MYVAARKQQQEAHSLHSLVLVDAQVQAARGNAQGVVLLAGLAHCMDAVVRMDEGGGGVGWRYSTVQVQSKRAAVQHSAGAGVVQQLCKPANMSHAMTRVAATHSTHAPSSHLPDACLY